MLQERWSQCLFCDRFLVAVVGQQAIKTPPSLTESVLAHHGVLLNRVAIFYSFEYWVKEGVLAKNLLCVGCFQKNDKCSEKVFLLHQCN